MLCIVVHMSCIYVQLGPCKCYTIDPLSPDMQNLWNEFMISHAFCFFLFFSSCKHPLQMRQLLSWVHKTVSNCLGSFWFISFYLYFCKLCCDTASLSAITFKLSHQYGCMGIILCFQSTTLPCDTWSFLTLCSCVCYEQLYRPRASSATCAHWEWRHTAGGVRRVPSQPERLHQSYQEGLEQWEESECVAELSSMYLLLKRERNPLLWGDKSMKLQQKYSYYNYYFIICWKLFKLLQCWF